MLFGMLRPSSGRNDYNPTPSPPPRPVPCAGMLRYMNGRNDFSPKLPSPPPPIHISTDLHPHSLKIRYPGSIYSEHRGDWMCDNCSNMVSLGMTSKMNHCDLCNNYDLCDSCLKDPIHQHPLTLVQDTQSIYPQANGHWVCDICKNETLKGMSSMMHHCSTCDSFDVCDQCLNGRMI